MDDNSHERSHTSKIEINYTLCIVCQKVDTKQLVNPKPESLRKLLKFVSDYADLGDANVAPIRQRLQAITIENLVENNAFYHKDCYSWLVNKRNLKRAAERYSKATKQQDASFITPKRGRPTSSQLLDFNTPSSSSSEVTPKRLRSGASPYDSGLCIICQNKGGWLHKVMTKEKGRKMLEVAQKHIDKSFVVRLNTLTDPTDAVANDVQYHQQCWIYAQRLAAKSGEVDGSRVIDDSARVIADIEILNAIECELENPTGTALNMNNINLSYINLLKDNNYDNMGTNYKRYLKQLIGENIPNIEFIKPRCQNESEKICSSKTKNDIVDAALENLSDDLSHIFKTAKLVRKSLEKFPSWKYTGSFDDYHSPEILKNLIKWIIIGPSIGIDTGQRKGMIDQNVENISQIILQSVKSNRKLNYAQRSTNTKSYCTKETPFAVGLGLLIHKKTRSKNLVNILSDFNLSINYDKVLSIETALANAVIKKMEDNNGVYVPPTIQHDSPVYFAVDNCDFHNDTPEGKDEFHGTAHIVYQKSTTEKISNKLEFERGKSRSLNHDPFPCPSFCPKPIPPNKEHTSFESDMKDVDLYRKWDCIWFLTKTLNRQQSEFESPTWAAYNSLITEELPITIYCGLPLYPAPPTDWSNLYEALKICQNISTSVSPGKKTIISLDLQLYSKALQLQAKDDINRNFIFRPWELHIVFAFLHAIGKYIEGSGLDQILIEAVIYGPASLAQILRGKHMKRSSPCIRAT